MRFTDFLFRADMIAEIRLEEQKERMTAAAYTAWLMGSGGKKSFKSYLTTLGLVEKPAPLTKEERKQIAQDAYTKAAKIVELDRNRKRRERR